ncbi:MAG: STAS domain-containing protein [Acidobacteriota bacterium]
MKIHTRRDRDDDVTVLSLDGKLTIGEGDIQLRRTVREVLDSGGRRILIDMKQVTAMDSAGLGELVGCKANADDLGAVIKLMNVEARVEKVLTMTRLIGVFETFENEVDAIASFR